MQIFGNEERPDPQKHLEVNLRLAKQQARKGTLFAHKPEKHGWAQHNTRGTTTKPNRKHTKIETLKGYPRWGGSQRKPSKPRKPPRKHSQPPKTTQQSILHKTRTTRKALWHKHNYLSIIFWSILYFLRFVPLFVLWLCFCNLDNLQGKAAWVAPACADCPGFMVQGDAGAPVPELYHEPQTVPLNLHLLHGPFKHILGSAAPAPLPPVQKREAQLLEQKADKCHKNMPSSPPFLIHRSSLFASFWNTFFCLRPHFFTHLLLRQYNYLDFILYHVLSVCLLFLYNKRGTNNWWSEPQKRAKIFWNYFARPEKLFVDLHKPAKQHETDEDEEKLTYACANHYLTTPPNGTNYLPKTHIYMFMHICTCRLPSVSLLVCLSWARWQHWLQHLLISNSKLTTIATSTSQRAQRRCTVQWQDPAYCSCSCHSRCYLL